ncbi:DinB family protein [Deinococcus yavapaiensis]|uniref:DinB family protein n=1 Tax=Deinococcus yavapaiensis KR-236 TaxID=694435 RepID=A0A318S4F3_9DEIO|nr:DinB family protein [Deinococcus yavapaiensis]PYE52940.1 DinB family protein [Deinococcus yavapaiensis KR-236]
MTNTSQPLLTGPSPEALERLLDEGSEFVAPSRFLEGLSAYDACRRVPGAPHTIAEIVAHLRYWQVYFLAVARDERPTPPAHASEGWPQVTEAEWDALRGAFLAGLAQTKRLAREGDLARVVRDRETLGYKLASHAGHNAVHVGQVILLRRMLGAWPPPSGGDTW